MPLSVLSLRHVRVGFGIWVVGALLLLPLTVRAEGEDPAAIEKVTNLNKKAVDAYNNLDFEDARKLLKQALDLCSSAGLDKHPVAARTHVHMGVVLIVSKQQDLGIKQFKRALEIQPDIQVTKALANPEIEQAFEEAAASVGQPGDSGDSGAGTGEQAARPESAGSAAEVTGDISLTPVTRGKKGQPVPVSATVAAELTGYSKVVLAYRAEGAPEFIGVDMRRSGNKFLAEIPAEATGGSVVHYYVEAETDDESAVASNGTEEKPYAVALSAGGPGGDNEHAASGEADEDSPKFFLSLAGGTGFGTVSGTGELNVNTRVDTGLAPSSAVQIVPEVGYFLMPHFRLSLQLRLQYVTGRTPLNLTEAINKGAVSMLAIDSCGSDRICSTGSPWAPSVFARGTWFFGSSALRPYFSLAVGAGVIRHVVTFNGVKPVCGTSGNQVCVDSVLAGPIFAGPGGGIHLALTPRFGFIAEVNSVIGFPKFTFHLDFNGGIAAQF